MKNIKYSLILSQIAISLLLIIQGCSNSQSSYGKRNLVPRNKKQSLLIAPDIKEYSRCKDEKLMFITAQLPTSINNSNGKVFGCSDLLGKDFKYFTWRKDNPKVLFYYLIAIVKDYTTGQETFSQTEIYTCNFKEKSLTSISLDANYFGLSYYKENIQVAIDYGAFIFDAPYSYVLHYQKTSVKSL